LAWTTDSLFIHKCQHQALDQPVSPQFMLSVMLDQSPGSDSFSPSPLSMGAGDQPNKQIDVRFYYWTSWSPQNHYITI